MPVDNKAIQKGGPPPLPMKPSPPPARDMTGVGKGPWPKDTNIGGVTEKDARTRAYRAGGTT
jgi:hypothetical protein